MTDFDLWTYNVWFNKNEKFSNDRRSLWPRIMSYFTRFSIGFSVSFWCSNCKMLEWLRKSVDFFWMWFINFAILKTLFNTDLINQSQSMNKNWITTKLIRIQQKSITQYWPFCLRLETFDFFFFCQTNRKLSHENDFLFSKSIHSEQHLSVFQRKNNHFPMVYFTKFLKLGVWFWPISIVEKSKILIGIKWPNLEKHVPLLLCKSKVN